MSFFLLAIISPICNLETQTKPHVCFSHMNIWTQANLADKGVTPTSWSLTICDKHLCFERFGAVRINNAVSTTTLLKTVILSHVTACQLKIVSYRRDTHWKTLSWIRPSACLPWFYAEKGGMLRSKLSDPSTPSSYVQQLYGMMCIHAHIWVHTQTLRNWQQKISGQILTYVYRKKIYIDGSFIKEERNFVEFFLFFNLSFLLGVRHQDRLCISIVQILSAFCLHRLLWKRKRIKMHIKKIVCIRHSTQFWVKTCG